MNYQESLSRVSEHVVRFYLDHTDERLHYHNLAHAAQMVDTVNKINSHYQLDDKNYFIVCTAAWFHDTGIVVAGPVSPGTKSAELAEIFLQNIGVNSEEITLIKKCMLATRMPQRPASLQEAIICDADAFGWGTETFKADDRRMRKEMEAFTNSKISGQEWRDKTIALLNSHNYHTEYCQSLLNKAKENNLRDIIRKQQEKDGQKHPHNAAHKSKHPLHSEITPGAQDAPASKKVKHHLRGVETMFRNSSSNHQRLSLMADNKAFIMISVNSIIISVAIGLVIGKFVLNPKLIIPTILLLSVNVATIIYAVLATRPKVMSGTFTKEDVEKKKVNLLFFGSFYKMPLQDFEYGIRQMMDDSEFLYGSIIKDIYWQGRVLGRKFRLLRISYDIFMYGTAVAVGGYVLSALF